MTAERTDPALQPAAPLLPYMNTKATAIALAVTFLAGCSSFESGRNKHGTSIASRALTLEAEKFPIGDARKSLEKIVTEVSAALVREKATIESTNGLKIVGDTIAALGYREKQKKDTVMLSNSLRQKPLDCSDLTLIYLEIAQRHGAAGFGCVFAPDHVFIAVTGTNGTIFWETTENCRYEPGDYTNQEKISPLSLSNNVYLAVYPPETALVCTYTEIGMQLMRKGKYREAEKVHRIAANLHPKFVTGLVNLGSSLYYQDKFGEARVVLEKALRLDDNYARAMGLLGMVEREDGNPGRAKELFIQSLKANPDSAYAQMVSTELILIEFETLLKQTDK